MRMFSKTVGLRIWSTAAAVVGMTLITALPVRAASFIINDTLPSELVELTFSGFSSVFLSANCTQAGSPATCTEDSVIAFSGFWTSNQPIGKVGVNLWEDFVGGVLSDYAKITISGDTPDVRHLSVVFQSDSELGPPLVPISPGEVDPDKLFNLVEGFPPQFLVSFENLDVQIASDPPEVLQPIPEPASMLLFGTGLAVVCARRLRKRA